MDILHVKAITYLKCSDYFKIQKAQKAIKLEDFYSDLRQKNPHVHFTHKMFEHCTFIYRSNRRNYAQMFNDKVEQLPIPSFYNSKMEKEKILCADIQTDYEIQLINTFDRYVNKARFELLKASNIFNIDFLNSDLNDHRYETYYIQRCFNAENAIYSYYSAFEILMQLIWIHKKYYKSDQTLERIMSGSFNTLKNNLRSENDTTFLPLFSTTKNGRIYLYNEIYTVRKWCDKFKHRGIIRFDGEQFEDEVKKKVTLTEQGKQMIGLQDYDSSDFAYQYLDLDYKVIPQLIVQHKKLLSVARNILKEIGLLYEE